MIAPLRVETAQLKAMLKADRRGASSGHGSGGSGGSGGGSTHTGGGSSNAGSGGGGASANPILQTTSTNLVVTVDLAASSQSVAMPGRQVMVEMPAGNTVNGRITAVSRVAQTSSASGGGGSGASSGSGGSGGSSSTIPVTITLSSHHAGPGLDQAAVSVTFTPVAMDDEGAVVSGLVVAEVAVAAEPLVGVVTARSRATNSGAGRSSGLMLALVALDAADPPPAPVPPTVASTA